MLIGAHTRKKTMEAEKVLVTAKSCSSSNDLEYHIYLAMENTREYVETYGICNCVRRAIAVSPAKIEEVVAAERIFGLHRHYSDWSKDDILIATTGDRSENRFKMMRGNGEMIESEISLWNNDSLPPSLFFVFWVELA